MQYNLWSRDEGVTVELMAAVVAGATAIGLGVATISRNKVCGKWIYILPWGLVTTYYLSSLQWNNNRIQYKPPV